MFAGLLVTDSNTQNSPLLVKGDAEVMARVSYPHVEKDEMFDLPGIVSPSAVQQNPVPDESVQGNAGRGRYA